MERLAITRRVAELAAAQHGNVDLGQLRATGLTDGAIRQRVDDGWLVPRHARVYAVGHVPRSRPSRWHAAVLALGPDAVLSYESAAALFEIVRGATKIEVTVPPDSGKGDRDGIVVHRQNLPPDLQRCAVAARSPTSSNKRRLSTTSTPTSSQRRSSPGQGTAAADDSSSCSKTAPTRQPTARPIHPRLPLAGAQPRRRNRRRALPPYCRSAQARRREGRVARGRGLSRNSAPLGGRHR